MLCKFYLNFKKNKGHNSSQKYIMFLAGVALELDLEAWAGFCPVEAERQKRVKEIF